MPARSPRPTPVPRPGPPPRLIEPRPLYTVEQANRTLPYVRRVTEDLVRDYARWRARARALETAAPGTRNALPDDAHRRLQRETRHLAEDVQRALGELAALGLECTSLEDGLIDFPAVIDDAPAFLCWKVGEPEVAWWHRPDTGFVGRQPIPGADVPPSLAGEEPR